MSTRQTLQDLQANVVDNVIFTAYIGYLNDDQLSFDIQAVFDNLTALATHFSDNMVHAEKFNFHYSCTDLPLSLSLFPEIMQLEAMANYTIEARDNLVGTTINMTIQEFNEIRVSTVTILVNVLHHGNLKQSFVVGNLTQLSSETQEIGVCF